ncbi:glutaminase A [Cohnella sp. CFH 77786]|uniref:glutaminase A n=1 Tax=Cohnella sp. CFH 77786 TaxID=2662265 RepID=UPI001C609A37|nr:glutaminase A [Cohnella sp. CFH 77786]MBW5448579.1 glutaminase A [Cohnella sp. CFH 77786]
MTSNSEMERLKRSLPEWVEESRGQAAFGAAASYIPELAKAPNDALGIVVLGRDGDSASAGDTDLAFTLQSISKVFTLILALIDRGEEAVFAKVGMEPSGDNFNSMLKLELVEPGIPFNPLINAGAIVVSSLISGNGPEEKKERILNYFRELTGNDRLGIHSGVYRSESETGHRNRSLAYFLKENGVLDGEVEDVLDVYFHHCAIEVNCAELARMALLIANDGRDPLTGTGILPRRFVQIAKTFMTTCGMYNASGEFAIRAGLPAKSGVSGGILAVVPGRYGIGLVGPALGRKGNSVAGVHLLERMSRAFDWSMF